ncbi:glycosyltransferase [Dellaglioa algida]|uniref:glycosyltransferase n=1 Tax=Dellaglioa algida TaxID=105612 RepID=UPI001CDB8F8E|nr:glycosyltransferase [Dellaglioa algida]MDK1717136.1 glycosyltransferase [Dellaglioa algida]MDK1719794.1 glycosyltransferase [Dellaglioa algida]MDK1722078.1 glycosyltransferase [Dellaglioa algida]MDK1723137.1 glycosyltransferase [Dellaglioa algida]MDK1739911.1 glycosyltransferase [Dellaglioa algida]
MIPKVSIIIPIYNVERFLDDCIKSCLPQKNTEIILINDGSTDGSENICMNYTGYSHVKYIKQNNMGLSGARNRGLKEATGKYILFVDSDDMIIPKMVESLLDIAESNDNDMILFSHKVITEKLKVEEIDNNRLIIHDNLLDKNKVSKVEILREIFKRDIQSYSWSMLVKREIYTDNMITFPVNRIYEDIATTYLIVGRAENIIQLPSFECYLYRNRKGSIANTASIKTAEDIIISLHEIDKYLDLNYPIIKSTEYINFIISFLLLGYRETYEANVNKLMKKNMKKNIKSEILNRVKISDLKNIKGKFGIAYILFRLGIFIPIQRLRGIQK